MARKSHSTITNDIEIILRDSSNTIFGKSGGAEEQDITGAITAGLREISTYVPDVVDHWLAAKRKSRYVDVSTRAGILGVNYAVWPLLLKDTSGNLIDDWDIDVNRRNVVYDGLNIRMDLRIAPTPSITDTLTGTVTFSDGSTAVSGSSTVFSTELRPGYYIKKSGSSTWYRVASITDATNIVLAATALTADDGADTAGATIYWRADVLVNCNKIHHLTSQSDLSGEVKVAHAKGVWQMNIDLLGTGTIDENLMFTIAGVDGTYRVTADATIAGNAATIYFEPGLEGIAPDNAVITFVGSSLTPRLEIILADLCAAHLAINWIEDGRTALETATSHLDTGDDLLNTVTLSANAPRDFIAYSAARQAVARSYMNLRQWGWDKLGVALRDLRKLQKVRVRHTYSSGDYADEYRGFR